MTSPAVVRVDLQERAYDIHIGSGLLGQALEFLRARRPLKHAVIVTDENVNDPYADPLGDLLADNEIDVHIFVEQAGEASKCVEAAEQLWEALLDSGADRDSVVVAVGGGVVGDLAGFAAATYARGISFFQIPTTLLAQVDSSVGGKTGVNLPSAKNMVGCFWQPAGVLIDVDTLRTLPKREFLAGVAEVVKYGVILDGEFFAYLEQNVTGILERDADVLTYIIGRCCQLKADVVVEDERETTGLRSVLNYGHTFGHALEAITGYGQLLHGEAVSIGMMCSARLAERLGRVDDKFVSRQHALLTALELPTAMPDVDHGELVHLMRRDKKAVEGRLRFVLPRHFGFVELVDEVRADDARHALSD